MERAWDYLMRRKSLLAVLILCFTAGSILSYQVLQSKSTSRPPQYISINQWGTPPEEVEIPRTGLEDETSNEDSTETATSAAFTVLAPQAVATLVRTEPSPEPDTPQAPAPSESQEGDNSETTDQTDDSVPAQPVDQPTAPNSTASTALTPLRPTATQSFIHNLAYNFMLAMAGLAVLGLLAYFAYWHYCR